MAVAHAVVMVTISWRRLDMNTCLSTGLDVSLSEVGKDA